MKRVEAPWNLKGSGYVLLYKFKKELINQDRHIPEFLRGEFVGGIGSVMIVNYETSNVGPYYELLLIPGKFNHANLKLNTISKIYVSSMVSVVNGRENWGIPKELADFKFTQLDDVRERVQVNLGDEIILDVTIKAKGLSVPITSKIMPFSLVQYYKERYYYTHFFGKGWAKLAKIEAIKINQEHFLDITDIKPLSVLKFDPFAITFPFAKITKKPK